MSQLQVKRKLTQDASQTKKRVVLTHAQKRQLCLDYQNTPRSTQEGLATLYNIKQNTVSDILKKKEKWLNVNPDSEESNKQREKPVRFPQVEEALSLWITNALAADLVINTDILREKAKFFAQQFEVNNFAASNGWINGFKERHSLKQYVKWGEAKSAPLETSDEERKILREIIKDYDLNDVFNCDETGIINSFKAQYRKLLVRNRIEAYEISQELRKETVPLNIYDAINFSKNAWNSVSQQTIFNCWKHTGILPQDEMDGEIEDDDQVFHDEIHNEMEIQELIYQLPFDDHMDVTEFLHIDDNLKGGEGLTDEEIVSMVKSKNTKIAESETEESFEVISTKEALGHLDDLVLFFEYSSDTSINSELLNVLKKLRRQVLTLYINNTKKTTLDSFIQ
ncbi:unnamed protein product [Rhizophagus irregularis]|nr:unnamed protein product [Rhizophagus irregularis]